MIETLGDLVLTRGGFDLSAFPEQRASIESPRTSIDQALIALSEGQMTWAGRSVSPDGALNIGAVFACVRILSGGVAMLDCLTFRGNRRQSELAEDHYLYRLLKDRVNSSMSAFRWKRLMMTWILLLGNAYSEVIASRNGRVTALLPIHPRRVRKYQSGYWVIDNNAGDERRVIPESMLHLRGMEKDESGLGLSVVTQARQTLGAAIATEEYGARLFSNGAAFGGFIKVPENLSEQAKKNLLAYINRHNGGLENAHKIMPLDGSMEFEKFTMSPEDAQFLGTRKHNNNEVSRWFGVPPHMIGDLDRATNNNIEHMGMEFVTHSLGPWLELFESEIPMALLSDMESKSIFVRFQRDELTQGDMQSRTKAWSTMVNGGIAKPNEARSEFGFNPDPDGDTLLANGTLTPVKTLAAKTSMKKSNVENN